MLRGIGDIDSDLPCPRGNTDILYKLELTEEEQEVLAHVNGRSTVEQICEVSYLTNFETCRILWALQVLGVVRRGPTARRSPRGWRERERELDLEEIVEKFNQMFSRVYGFLQRAPRAKATSTRSWRVRWRRSRASTARSSTAWTCGTTDAPTSSRCWPTWPTCRPSSARASWCRG